MPQIQTTAQDESKMLRACDSVNTPDMRRCEHVSQGFKDLRRRYIKLSNVSRVLKDYEPPEGVNLCKLVGYLS